MLLGCPGLSFPREGEPSPAQGVGAASLLPGTVLGGERGMSACREQAEVEVQDPKARAKANWLRAFNKVCMQLQEVSNPAAICC